MFHRKKGPDKAFSHATDCKIVAADPGVKIEWSEIRKGVWEAVCTCGKQFFYDPVGDDRTKLDPFDPKTMRHGPGCVVAEAPDPTMHKAALKVTEKSDGGYWWVTCGSCDYGWQVPFSVEKVG